MMLGRVLAYLRAQWIGVLALLIALGTGTAYAANTIGSADIINGQVKSVDIGTGQVQSVDIKDDGINRNDLGFASVGPEELDFFAVTDKMRVPNSVSTAMNTQTAKEVQANCIDAHEKVTGGGFVVSGPGGDNVPNVVVQRSYAVDDHDWLVRAVATSGTPQWQLTAVVDCVA